LVEVVLVACGSPIIDWEGSFDEISSVAFPTPVTAQPVGMRIVTGLGIIRGVGLYVIICPEVNELISDSLKVNG
jgi:hypothetical protein